MYVFTDFQDSSQWAPPAGIHAQVQSPHTVYQGWAMKPIEFTRSDGISLLSLDGFFLNLFGSLGLRALRQSCGEAHIARNCGLLPQPCAWPNWKRLPAPAQPSPHMTASLVNTLTLASRETLTQSHPAMLLPNSWPWETLWDNKYLLF